MHLELFELFNIFVAGVLIYQVLRNQEIEKELFFLFLYGSLHFGFSAFTMVAYDSSQRLSVMHTRGGGVLANLSALSVLTVVLVLWIKRVAGLLPDVSEVDRRMIFHFVLSMLLFAVGYLLNFRTNDWSQLKNVLAYEAMMFLLLMGCLCGGNRQNLSFKNIRLRNHSGLALLILVNIVGIYEVFWRHSWAWTAENSGDIVYRASGLLFNPNLLAFWSSLIYLGCSYCLHAYHLRRYEFIFGMVLSSFAIYLSGSRTFGYLLLAAIFITMVPVKTKISWCAAFIFPAVMAFMYLVSAWLFPIIFPNNDGWHSLALLGERFMAAPLYLVNYVLQQLEFSPVKLLSVMPELGVPPEIALSIEGRFFGTGRDAGWLVLYDDVGWIGSLGAAYIFITFFSKAFQTYWMHRSVASVYAIAILCNLTLAGTVMRIQIFPVWLFMCIALVPCVVFWRNTSEPTTTTIF
jgi:hypothetical protein